MSSFPFDDTVADMLLVGGVHPDDAPPGLQDVARLIQVARMPASAAELADEDRLVAAFAAAVEGTWAVAPVRRRRRPMIASKLSAKAALATATFLLLGGGVAAAATGSLPSPVQSSLARGLSHLGISVPDPGGHRQPTGSSPAGSATGTAVTPTSAPRNGPVVPGPSTAGLCAAYAASGRSEGSKGTPTAFAQLNAAAAAKGESVDQFCASTTTPTSEPTTTPTTTPSTEQGHGGPPSGVTTGPPSGVTTGPPTRVTTGPPAGVTTGPPAGVTTGPPAGVTTGPPAGVTTGPPSGVTTGPPSGVTTGPPSGTGRPAGVTTGPPSGTGRH